MDSSSHENPYPGLRAFEAKDSALFFGRDAEIRQLAHLVVAHRVVLLFAQSGAGKTSLLKAGVIPRLEEKDEIVVLPVTRIGGRLPPGLDGAGPQNIFVYNILSGLAGPEGAVAALAGMSLLDGLRPYLAPGRDDGAASPYLLVLDQFEEIFTSYPERREERGAFFRELQACLTATPQLSLLISMREDYIAELDPYVAQMPDRLRTRFRIERLNYENALAAVRQPAAGAGRPFEPGVAEGLVDDLRRLQRARRAEPGGAPARSDREPLGEYVEPVHLQIVCHQLWENLPPGGATIRQTDVQAFGDVDEALTEFYRSALKTAQETGIPERRLRLWFDQQMITPAGTRGLAYRGDDETAGLPNKAVDVFYNGYLIRPIARGGDVWYELAHDRLVEPIRSDNAAWLKAHQNVLQNQAALWQERGRPADLLLRGSALGEAESWAAGHSAELTDPEREFLGQSQSAQAAAARELRQARRIRGLAVVAAGLALVFLAALLAALFLLARVREQQELALARQLAAQSATYREDQLDLALLLSVEANRVAGRAAAHRGLLDVLQPGRVVDTTDARGSLLTALETNPALITYLRAYTGAVTSVAFHPDQPLVATGGMDGRVIVWDRQQPLLPGPALPGAPRAVTALAFSPDGRWLAAGGLDGDIVLWDLAVAAQDGVLAARELAASPPPSRAWQAHDGQVSNLAFLAGPHRPALISQGKTDVAVWDPASPAAKPLRRFGNGTPVYSMALHPRGETLATGHEGVIEFWDMIPLLEPSVQAGEVVTSVACLPVEGARVDALAFGGEVLAVGASPSQKKAKTEAAAGAAVEPGTVPVIGLLPLIPGPGSGQVYLPRPGWELCRAACKPADSPVESLAYSAAGLLAATGSGRSVMVWKAATTDEFERSAGQPLAGHQGRALAVAFSPDGKRLASGGEEGLAILWEPDAAPRLSERRLVGAARPARRGAGSLAEIYAVAFSPDGKRLAAGGESRATELWDLASGAAITLTDPLSDVVRSVAFSPAGERLAAAKQNGRVALWDMAPAAASGPLALQHSPDAPAVSVAFSPDGRQLASGGFDHAVRLWDLGVSPPISREVGSLPGNVFAVAFGPDGGRVSAAGADGIRGIFARWNLPAGRDAVFTAPAPSFLLSVAVSSDGKRTAAGGQDGKIRLWEAGAPDAAPLDFHTGAAIGLAFSPTEPSLLASGGEDGGVILWDAAVRRPIGEPLRGHAAGKAVNSVAFSPDGRRLASAGDDQAIVLWDVDLAGWQAKACLAANRNLTEAEWKQYLGEEPYRKTCPDLP